MRHVPLAAAILAVYMPNAAHAQDASVVQSVLPVGVVIEIPTPPGATRALIDRGILASVPQYRAVPGLLRKYFTIGEGKFGGVYLFASRAAADTWFSEVWRARVVKTYGKPATITYYDVPVVLDNANVPASAVAPQ